MIRADAGVVGDDAVETATAKVRALVLRAFGEAGEDAESVAGRLLIVAGLAKAEDMLPGVTGDDLAKEIRWAVRRYLERRAATSALALVFDDIHWAEPELLDLIEHLAERARAPLFVASLTRPDLRERRPTWGGGLTNASAVRLEPLDASETRRLIAALLAIDDLAEDLRAEIVRRAEGNPLYVEELLRMLLESGQIEQREGRFVATGDARALSIPPTLEGLLAARLDQLDAVAKRAVRIGSVIGHAFYPGALVALGIATSEVDAALARAVRSDLILELDERGPDGRAAYSFKHILIRDAAYESLPKAERWQLHDGVGRWLEALPGAGDLAGVVAYHAEQAFWIARELREEAASLLGERALQLALDEARRRWELESSPHRKRELYQGVLRIAEATAAPDRMRIEALGRAALMSVTIEGRSALPRVRSALDEARALGPSDVLVEMLVELALFDHQDALQEGRRAAGEGIELYAEAVQVAETLGDPWLIAHATHASAWPAWWEGRITEARDIWARAFDRLRASSVQKGRGMFLARLSSTSAVIGDMERALRYTDEHERTLPALPATAFNRKVMPHVLAMNRSRFLGDLEAWATHARRVREASTEVGDERPFWHSDLALALHCLGRDEDALPESDRALEIHERSGLKGFIGEERQQRARILLSLGRLPEARAEAEKAYEEIKDPDPFSRSTTSLALGLVREAEGRTVEAERLLRQAVECPGEYRNLAAHARIDLGRFLMRQRRHTEARAVLEAARDFFVVPHALGWHDRVDTLIRECDAVAAAS
jgi:tetratricopeptide (TPR) repeat protein